MGLWQPEEAYEKMSRQESAKSVGGGCGKV